MPQETTKTFIELTRGFLGSGYTLAVGPNTLKSRFGRILEGAFRKDYFTLQAIVMLIEMIDKDPAVETAIGGSVLDLSRRVFEDMVYMEYILKKGKDKYSKQFFDYAHVEQKKDMDFLLAFNVKVDKDLMKKVNEDYKSIPKRLKSRKNWAGQDVETTIEWFVSQGIILQSERETMLKIYMAGNRKNHTSPGDILDHTFADRIDEAASKDLNMGLMVTLTATISVAIKLCEEIDTSKEVKDEIQSYWDKLVSLK